MLRRCLAEAYLWLAFACAAAGADFDVPLHDYLHSVRTQVEGRALSASAIAQTTDGYLWIGTADGLVRYDGLSAEQWEPRRGERLPDKLITALCVDSFGVLWIGTSAGLSRLQDGRLTTYTQREGLPPGQVLAIAEDAAGAVWVGTGGAHGGGLISISRGIVKPAPDPVRNAAVLSLLLDSRRNLWIGTSDGLYEHRPGASGPLARECAGNIISVIEDSAGRVLFIDSNRGVRYLSPVDQSASKILHAEIPVASKLLRDSHRNIWVATAGQGLFRLRGSLLEQFTRRNGLSNDLATALFEDSEGSIWAGTAGGVDQFREPRLSRWSTAAGLSGNLVTAVLATHEGGIWAGTLGGGLDYLWNGRVVPRLRGVRSKGANVTALCEDSSGRLWLATSSGLGYLSDDRFVEVRAAGGARLDRVFVIADGGSDTLWVADAAIGLLRLRGGTAQPVAVPEGAGRHLYTLHPRTNGETWIGYFEGGIAVLDKGGRASLYDAGSGLASGAIQDIYEDVNGNLWVGTAGGLSRFRNGRWTTWTERQRFPGGGVQAILGDRQGRLWITTRAGLLCLERAPLEESPDGQPRDLSFTLLGPGEGFRPRRTRTIFTPRMARSPDGRLWISSDDGLVVVDPARIARDVRPLPVAISRVAVDGNPVDASSGKVEFRGNALELDFSAVTFVAPEAVRFRYKLDGFEPGWTYTQNSRRIVYSNLPPGRYSFHVTAAGADGVWNGHIATLALSRLPWFYQTRLFFFLCATAVATCAWALYRFRIGQIRAGFNMVLRERSRLTREIHDTVLQGFAGVVYQLQAASNSFEKSPETSRQRLERALALADRSLREARQAISCMRLTHLENGSLSEALSEMGTQSVDGTSIGFEMTMKGRAHPLRYDVQAALYLIAREAVVNAVRHANPRRISLALIYSGARVEVTIRDDGSGFDPNREPQTGHLGAIGMRERASEIDARLDISSQPGRGTTVTVAATERRRDHSTAV